MLARIPDPRGDDLPVIDAVRAEWADSWEHCSQVCPGWLLWSQLLHHRTIQLHQIVRGEAAGTLPTARALAAARALMTLAAYAD